MLLAVHLATVGATAVFILLALIDVARWAIVRGALKRKQPPGQVRHGIPLATLQRLVVRWAVVAMVFASAALATGAALAFADGLSLATLWPKVVPAIAAWLLLGAALWRGQLTGWRLSQLRLALLFVAILLLVTSLLSIRQ
jgi:ABC-type uncharacterized transport system permease subunit